MNKFDELVKQCMDSGWFTSEENARRYVERSCTPKKVEDVVKKYSKEYVIFDNDGDIHEGLRNAKDKLAYLRDEAEKRGFVFSNNPYKVLPDVKELCEFFKIPEYKISDDKDIDEEEELFGV